MEPGLSGHREPLRVAVLIDSFTLPAWVARVLEEIESSGIARIVLVIKNEAPPSVPSSFFSRLLCRRHFLFYDLYRKLDRLRFAKEPDAFKKMGVENRLSQIPSLAVKPVRKNHSDYFSEDSLAQIREYRLDVAIRFGFGILRGDVLGIARYGIWSYHHDDNQVYRGGPAGFWEVMEMNPVTGSVLQILTEALDDGRVIYRSYAPTHPFSVWGNQNNYYWKSSAFVVRKLREVYESGAAALEPKPSGGSSRRPSAPLYREPRNLKMAWLLMRLLVRYFIFKWHQFFFFEQWSIAFRLKDEAEPPSFALSHFQRVVPPKDSFWADPFPVRRGGRNYIFLEEYLEKKAKGRIAVMEVDDDGRWEAPRPVLEADYHLSYPFVFSWKGQDFMIPETASQKRIELYRSLSFPSRWEREKVLMEGVNAVDATLAEIEGVWWMFVNLAVEGTSNSDELHLFYADEPLGPWKPHQRNPVVSDARRACPAGRVFRYQNAWYRPSQDCGPRYGYSILIHKILRLSPNEFQEAEASQILPQWQKGVLATHTYNLSERLTVVDGLFRRRRFL